MFKRYLTSRSQKNQFGFLLLETALALIIVAITGAIALNIQVSELRDAKAIAQGKAMLHLQGAANSYITNYYTQLQNNLTIPLPGGATVNLIYEPTIDELNKLNVGLPENFQDIAFIGGQYRIKLQTNPSPCTATQCQISAIAWITNPLTEMGNVDYPRLAIAAKEMGEDGAMSTNLDASGAINNAASAMIYGIYNKFTPPWSKNNPAGNVPGILAVRAGYDSQIMSTFLRRDGQSQMTGNLQMGDGITNNSIVNLKNITANGVINSSTLNAANAINANAVNAVNAVSSSSLAASGTASAANILATNAISGDTISSTGRLTSNDLVQIDGVVTLGQPCSPAGLIGVNTEGALLSCQAGVFKRAVKTPNSYRYIFTSSQDWTVPAGIQGAFVTMAGGGASGAGWRVSSSTRTGASGGYVFSQPINLTPGETIRVEVGKGGIAYTPYDTGVDANYPVTPPYHVSAEPQGDDGTAGYPGSSSKLVSPTQGTLLECTGGSGATFFKFDNFNGPLVVGNVKGAQEGSGNGQIQAIARLADGPYSSYSAPGACGSNGYGYGNVGNSNYDMTSGLHNGGRTPFGYGSGGDVWVSGCFITPDLIGLCTSPYYGRDGIVFIDVLY